MSLQEKYGTKNILLSLLLEYYIKKDEDLKLKFVEKCKQRNYWP